MSTKLELAIERDGERLRLLAPEVGLFACACAAGEALAAGESAGVILALGRTFELIVPEGVAGVVVSKPPERSRHPVGFGDVLYELVPHAGARAHSAKTVESNPKAPTSGLALRAPQSGRFYHRSAPGEPAFVVAGDVVKDGQPVGLIEVMKTFSHVTYRAGNALPPRARVLRFVAKDGADVKSGDVLLELEPDRS